MRLTQKESRALRWAVSRRLGTAARERGAAGAAAGIVASPPASL